MSKEIQRADNGFWKGDTVKISSNMDDDMESDDEFKDCVEYVHSSTGLYPSPMARNAKSSQRTKTRNKFVFIGKFIAKVSKP